MTSKLPKFKCAKCGGSLTVNHIYHAMDDGDVVLCEACYGGFQRWLRSRTIPVRVECYERHFRPGYDIIIEVDRPSTRQMLYRKCGPHNRLDAHLEVE